MTDFVYSNGDTVTYSDGTIATAGYSTTTEHVETNDRVIVQPVPKLPAGVKPTGPVEINWEHPLTAGLTSFVIPVGDGLLHNVVSNELITCDSFVGKYKPVQHYGQGVTNESQGDAWRISTAAEVNKALRGLHEMQDDGLGTLLVHFYKMSGGYDTYSHVFSARDGSSGQRFYIINNGASTTEGQISYSWNDYTIVPHFATHYNTLYTIGVAVDSSNEYLFVNGVLKNSRGGGGSITRSTNLGILGQNFAADDNDTFGGALFFATWNRKLPAAEQLLIHDDPYQFLKPAVPVTQIITTPPPANTSLRVPDPKWEAPALLQAGVKPTGPVVIDWDHPITVGLKTAVLLQNGTVKSLIDDPLFPNGWGLYSGASYVHDGVECASDNSCIRSTDQVALSDRTSGTVLMHFRHSVLATEPSYLYFFYHSNFEAHSIYNGGTADGGSWFINGTNQGAALGDIPSGTINQEYVISFVWDYDADYYEVWNDGKVETDSTARVPNYDYYNVGGREDAVSRYSNGVVKTFFMWDRQLTQEEQKAMSIDPYQFLIPA